MRRRRSKKRSDVRRAAAARNRPAVFVFMAIAMVRAHRNLGPAQALPEADRALKLLFILIAVTIILGATFFFLVWRRRRISIWLNQPCKGNDNNGR